MGNLDSAFWVYNLVANMAYGERYRDVYPLVQQEITNTRTSSFERQRILTNQLLHSLGRDQRRRLSSL